MWINKYYVGQKLKVEMPQFLSKTTIFQLKLSYRLFRMIFVLYLFCLSLHLSIHLTCLFVIKLIRKNAQKRLVRANCKGGFVTNVTSPKLEEYVYIATFLKIIFVNLLDSNFLFQMIFLLVAPIRC